MKPSRLLSSRPAFALTAVYGLTWFVQQAGNIGWDGWGQLVQFFITLVLLREARAEGKATQAKLDELLAALPEARDELAHAEERAEAEVDQLRR